MAIKEIHNAIVTRNTDLDKGTSLRGAVFFEAKTLFDGEFPIPAEPCFPFASENGAGFFVVPKVGDEIEIEIEADDGTDDTTDIELPEPRWRCMVYSDAADIDERFKENYPNRSGWKTPSGHFLLFDDKEGEEFFELLSSKGHIIKMDDKKGNESILIQHLVGTGFLIDKDGTLIEVIKKDRITGIGGDKAEIIVGDETKMIIGNETVTTSLIREHTAFSHVIAASTTIQIGSSGATENLVLGLQFTMLYNAHQHIGNLGIPSGPPIMPMTAAQLATKVFTEP